MNKIQIRAEILTLITKLQNIPQVPDSEFENLVNCEDKKTIMQVLLKELSRAYEQKSFVICYMLTRLFDNNVLNDALWEFIKDKSISDYAKMVAFNLLKDLGNNVNYEDVGEYFDEFDSIIDEDTKQLLKSAIINPEAQIDFMDFLNAVPQDDKLALINSLGDDYSDDALANILIPVFLHNPNSDLGKRVLEILGESKSELALHALESSKSFVAGETQGLLNKALSTLKIAGIRIDNTLEFYKDILSVSKPYKSYVSYPDGHGNVAIVFSRLRNDETLQVMAVVINDKFGILDCFGFNELFIPDFDRIVSRFFTGIDKVEVEPAFTRYILDSAEEISRNNDDVIPYEYLCWKSLLLDIEPRKPELNIERVELSHSDVETICLSDLAQRWFLDTRTSDEFNLFINKLNAKLKENNFDVDLDKFIAQNFDEIFTETEINHWCKIFNLSAYLKLLEDNLKEAQLLYSLRDNYQFLTNIVRKSIYENYVALRHKLRENNIATNIFRQKNNEVKNEFELIQLDLIISTVEAKWVQNV